MNLVCQLHRMNNKDVKVGRLKERLAALHGSQFMAEIYNSLLKNMIKRLLWQELKAQICSRLETEG